MSLEADSGYSWSTGKSAMMTGRYHYPLQRFLGLALTQQANCEPSRSTIVMPKLTPLDRLSVRCDGLRISGLGHRMHAWALRFANPSSEERYSCIRHILLTNPQYANKIHNRR